MKNNRTMIKMSYFGDKIVIGLMYLFTKYVDIISLLSNFSPTITSYLLRKGVSFVTRVGAGSQKL